ncbi:MAG TPA: RDD family protein [Actinotalea sp.]
MGKRLLAFVIDQVAGFLLGGAVVLGSAVSAFRQEGGWTTAPVGLLVGAALVMGFAVFQWCWLSLRGWTVGKRLVGLRVLSATTGKPVGLGRGLVRFLVPALGVLVVGVGELVVYASPLFDHSGRRQGWHDKAAGTVVFDVVVGRDPVLAEPVSRSQAAQRYEGLLEVPEWHRVSAGPAAPEVAAPREAVPGVVQVAVPSAQPAPPPAAQPAAQPSAQPTLHRTTPTPAATDAPVRDGMIISSVPRKLHADSTGGRTLLTSNRPATTEEVPMVQPTLEHPPAQLPVTDRHATDRHVTDRHAAEPVPSPIPLPRELTDPTRRPSPDLSPDVERTRLRPARAKVPQVPAGRPAVIELTDGRRIELAGTALVGRRPTPRAEDAEVELIAVADPGRSVSKTHLAIGVDHSGVWIRDRDSTNGTVVTLADGQQILCAAEQQVRVPVGATVAFGDYGLTVAQEPSLP